jgi:peptide/nickel transport system ATP-binding protein
MGCGMPPIRIHANMTSATHAPSDPSQEKLLTIEDLRTYFFLDEGTVKAVDGVDLEVPRGKTVCIVGESGCGKSITAFSILRLISHPGKIVSGKIVLHGRDHESVITEMQDDGGPIRRIRGNQIAMIFQEPMTSLSPVNTVGSQILEAIRLHRRLPKAQARAETVRIMGRVGIPDPDRRFGQYPHELSGGLRQRAMIAMGLSCQPDLLIADEPTTALDVTIQAQILDLMRDLQEEFGMSILLITHDLGVVAEMADEVAVMYMGRVVEHGSTEKIFENPQHPYTRALLQSVPGLTGARKVALRTIRGSVPDPFARLEGCPFHPRCDEAVAGKCNVGPRPPLKETLPAHRNACLIRHEESIHGKVS